MRFSAVEPRISRHIRHVVTEIVAPWGAGVEERPAVLSEEERGRRKKGEEEGRREGEEEGRREGEKEGKGRPEDDEEEVVGVVEGTAVAS